MLETGKFWGIRNNIIKVNGFIKKWKELVFVVVESILAISKKICQNELLMYYYIGISLLGGLFLVFRKHLEDIKEERKRENEKKNDGSHNRIMHDNSDGMWQ